MCWYDSVISEKKMGPIILVHSQDTTQL